MKAPSHSAEAEEESLKLVEDFNTELMHALDSLHKKSVGLLDQYRFWSSKHLQRAVDGFAFLRRSGRIDGSKFLVRPALEMAFRLQAVRKHPDSLYRIEFSEHHRDEQLLQEDAKRSEQPYDDTQIKQKWKRFSDAFTTEFPDIPKVDKALTIQCIAARAGMRRIYNNHYRIYCRYTHGAVLASTGDLDEATDRADNRAMATCALVALDNLISLGAKSSNRDRLVQRLSDMAEEPAPNALCSRA
jgi:hypothetical protein